MTDPLELARLLVDVADELDSRMVPGAGVVRQGARALSALRLVIPEEDGCLHCGGPVVYAGRGRPPLYCKDAHRSAAWRERKRHE